MFDAKYEVLLESSWTVTVVTALVKEGEGRPRSHFHKPIASVCHVTPCREHALFLHNAFLTSCFVLSEMDGKIKQHVCEVLCGAR
jgi:hypothetical protein